MKRSLPAVLVALALAAGVFAWVQYSGASSLRQQIADSTAAREAALKATQAAEAELARVKAESELAKENIARLTAERDAALARAKSAPVAATSPEAPGVPKPGSDTGGKGMMEGFAKMFSTEEGKKMMRAQMSMAMKMQYGSLAKDLKLDPKVADQVLGLLADRQAAISEAAFGAMKNGTLDEAATKEMAEKSSALKNEYDEKLKAVLGDEGMAQMKDYERTLGDRMMLAMHEQQFAAAGSALEQPQRDGLLQVMKEERMKTPPNAFDMTNQGDPAKQMAAMRDDAAVENWLKQEEAYQQRVLQSSTRVLNPDQVNTLRESFKQQLDMQRFGIKMSKEMFKGSGDGAAVIVAPAK
jgi:cell division protein FtsB